MFLEDAAALCVTSSRLGLCALLHEGGPREDYDADVEPSFSPGGV